MSKTITIGDLHGHYNQLIQLFFKLTTEHDVDFAKDTFVFLGDYVDGGPDTKKVLDKLIEYKEKYPHWKFIFGNHESLLLDAFHPDHPIYGDYYLWHNQGGKETLDSFIPDGDFSDYEKAIMQPKDLITEKYLNFIKNLDLYYETDNYFFVHGGLYPNRTIEAHLEAVKSFDPVLMEEGDMAYDMIWMRDPFIGSDYDWGKKVIFGHTCFPYGPYWCFGDNGRPTNDPGFPFIRDNKIGIDTMRHNEGRLTALILPEEEFVYSQWSE